MATTPLLITDDDDTRREVLAAARVANVDIETATTTRGENALHRLICGQAWRPLVLGADVVPRVDPFLEVTHDVIVTGTVARDVYSAARKVQGTITVTILVLPSAAKTLAQILAANAQMKAAA